jgi:YfiH family protein
MAAAEHLTDGFAWTREAWGRGLRSRPLSAIAAHVFTTRDLTLTTADCEWAAVSAALGATTLVRLRQVHGANIVHVRRGDRRDGSRPEADILVSDDPEVAIAVQAADCIPLLMADARRGVVAAAHAGWRGMAARVPQRTVGALADAFGSQPSDVVAAVGPSIGPCCYEVGPELVDAFARGGFDEDARQRWFRPSAEAGRFVLDLWTAAIDQLTAAGVPSTRIHVARLCTATHAELFPSYRRQGTAAGRIAGAIRAGRRK